MCWQARPILPTLVIRIFVVKNPALLFLAQIDLWSTKLCTKSVFSKQTSWFFFTKESTCSSIDTHHKTVLLLSHQSIFFVLADADVCIFLQIYGRKSKWTGVLLCSSWIGCRRKCTTKQRNAGRSQTWFSCHWTLFIFWQKREKSRRTRFLTFARLFRLSSSHRRQNFCWMTHCEKISWQWRFSERLMARLNSCSTYSSVQRFTSFNREEAQSSRKVATKKVFVCAKKSGITL